MAHSVHWRYRKDVPRSVYACGVYQKVLAYSENVTDTTCGRCWMQYERSLDWTQAKRVRFPYLKRSHYPKAPKRFIK